MRFSAELSDAKSAVAYAKTVRSHHRRRSRRDSPQRKADIEVALDRLKRAMEPIRSIRGRAQFERIHNQELQRAYDAVETASQALQAERRKLWKMLPHG